MKTKKFLAAAAAVLTMTCVPLNAYADTLAERDGLKYCVGKNVYDFRKMGDFDRKMYYAYFEIEAD